MVRTLLFCLLSITTVLAHAQIWCAPGATWTCTHTDGWTYNGMARYQYTGDTVIAGTTAQIIALHTEGYYWPWDTVLVGDGQLVFTTVVGDRIDLWTGTGFDTLYDFAAVPGDHWQLNTPSGVDPFMTLTVEDTGHAMIDGLELRYLVTTLDGWSSDTVFERLGSLPYQFVPWALEITDAANGPLRCYEDADINYHAPGWTIGCGSFTGIPAFAENEIIACPNPGTDGFSLRLPQGMHHIALFDATGRMTMQQHSNGPVVVIDTAHLPSGVYTVRVDDGPRCLRWVKKQG